MHPLKNYLSNVDESASEFASRVGASRQTLYRIINGFQAPKPALARRIVEATGGAISFDMLYAGQAPGKVLAFPSRANDNLDQDKVRAALSIAVSYVVPAEMAHITELLDVAAEAVVTTFSALSSVGECDEGARIREAFRPIIGELLRDVGAPLTSGSLDRSAELAASIYAQSQKA